MPKATVSKRTTNALILRCHVIHDSSYDSETLVPAQAGEPRAITKQERSNLLTHMSKHSVYGRQYVLIEPLTSEEVQQAVDKAQKRARDHKLAEERRLAAAEKKRKAAELARKKKRLAKLEALAREAK